MSKVRQIAIPFAIGLCLLPALLAFGSSLYNSAVTPLPGITFFAALPSNSAPSETRGKETVSAKTRRASALFSYNAGKIFNINSGGPAARAGILTGDTILGINGVPLSDRKALLKMETSHPFGTPIEYRVRTSSGEKTIRIQPEPLLKNFPVILDSLVDILVVSSFLVVGFSLFFRRPGDARILLFLIFSSLTAANYLIIPLLFRAPFSRLGIYPDPSSNGMITALLGMILGLFSIVSSSVLLNLTMIFPAPIPIVRRFPRLTTMIYAFQTSVMAAFLITALLCGIMTGLFSHQKSVSIFITVAFAAVILAPALPQALFFLRRKQREGWRPALFNHPWKTTFCLVSILTAGLLLFMLVLFNFSDPDNIAFLSGMLITVLITSWILFISFSTIPLAIICLWKGYRSASPDEKRQARWPMWGTAVSLIVTFVIITASFLALLIFDGPNPDLKLIMEITAKLCYIFIPVSFAIGVVKDRLMDIDIIIRKTLVYAIVMGILLLAFFSLAGVLGASLVRFAGVQDTWGIIAATLISVALLVPVQTRVQRILDRKLFRSRQGYAEALSSLRQIANAPKDRTDFLLYVAEELQTATKSRCAAIFLREGDTWDFRSAVSVGLPERSGRRHSFSCTHSIQKALETNRHAVLSALPADETRPLQRLGIAAIFSILRSGKVDGFLAVGTPYRGSLIDKDDLEFLAQVSEITSSGMDRLALRVQSQDLETAREIQSKLLPQEYPVIPGLDIASAWHPSRQVGGDYFDLLGFPEGRLGVVIADVAGKGMSAALLMSNLQAAFRALADDGLRPSSLASRLNHVLASQVATGRFITFFYGLYDPRERSFHFVNAGHCPPLLVRRNGNVIRLEKGGTILGVFPEQEYEEGTVHLEPGDRIALYTDGISEAATPSGEEFGEERLIGLTSESGTGSLQDRVRHVVDVVRTFADGDPHDDITLVLLEARP